MGLGAEWHAAIHIYNFVFCFCKVLCQCSFSLSTEAGTSKCFLFIAMKIARELELGRSRKHTKGRAPVWGTEFITKAATLEGGVRGTGARAVLNPGPGEFSWCEGLPPPGPSGRGRVDFLEFHRQRTKKTAF